MREGGAEGRELNGCQGGSDQGGLLLHQLLECLQELAANSLEGDHAGFQVGVLLLECLHSGNEIGGQGGLGDTNGGSFQEAVEKSGIHCKGWVLMGAGARGYLRVEKEVER